MVGEQPIDLFGYFEGPEQVCFRMMVVIEIRTFVILRLCLSGSFSEQKYCYLWWLLIETDYILERKVDLQVQLSVSNKLIVHVEKKTSCRRFDTFSIENFLVWRFSNFPLENFYFSPEIFCSFENFPPYFEKFLTFITVYYFPWFIIFLWKFLTLLLVSFENVLFSLKISYFLLKMWYLIWKLQVLCKTAYFSLNFLFPLKVPSLTLNMS